MKKTILFLGILFLTQILSAQDFKTIGYLPHYRFSLSHLIEYERLTHLNLAFLNPDSLGNWSIGGQDIDPIVQKARMKNPDIEVFISIAGGALTNEWAAAYDKFMQPAMLPGFIHSLIEYVDLHDLDGVDVDLEWSHVNELYSPFVLQLKDSLDVHGYTMTAALPGTYRYPDISNDALAAYDWINMMSYDLTGPWAPNNPGPHSPFSFAQQSISYWVNQGVPKQKLTLGVPFYGYDFNNQSNVTAFTYGGHIAADTSYAWVDQVGEKYYNGIPTIEAKTQLALQELSGIMIWEIGQDAFGAQAHLSLLRTIDETINVASSLEDDWQNAFSVYPNPFQDQVSIQRIEGGGNVNVEICDLEGRILWQAYDFIGTQPHLIDLATLTPGFYFLRIREGERAFFRKLVKY